MNHRLKDKAATLNATSLQGDKDEGVRGQAEPRLVPKDTQDTQPGDAPPQHPREQDQGLCV